MSKTKSKISKIVLIGFSVFALLAVVAFALFQYSNSRTSQFFGKIVHRVDTSEKVVALTFDDGPNESWAEIKQTLDEKNVKATFYLIGKEIETHKSIAQDIAMSGHELGNHSYSHPRFLLQDTAFVKEEVERTNQFIRETGYQGAITFRPPYGKKLFTLPHYLSEHNITTVTWDVEPDTYLPQASPQEIADYIKAKVKPGSIVLIHPWQEQRYREAIKLTIQALQEEGYQFVTVQQLLEIR